VPGRYRIFLGMAAGVGKTYRMLAEAQAEAEAGRDVVIGLVEPHQRADTERQTAGLERIPQRRVSYRGVNLQELDLPGILARAPELTCSRPGSTSSRPSTSSTSSRSTTRSPS
jgi:two-component system sensor histidine kinase KdpD